MRLLRVAAVVALTSCSSKADLPAQNPPGWDSEIALKDAVDRNPDPSVVEVDLAARVSPVTLRAGQTTQVWAYADVGAGAAGTLPGPRIHAKVGDRVIVHFKNELPEATTIHWHGVRVPNAMDGFGKPVVPAGGSFDYDFVVPDAGTFWYHPHADAAAQVGYGLYGALVVDDPAGPKLGDETTLVLSDISLDDSGKLLDSKVGGAIGDLFGREGEVLLANGRVTPTIHARAGAPQRWRLINAAKSRYYRIAMEGQSFVRVGSDGGLRTHPVTSNELLLVPGERADVVIVPRGAAGSVFALKWLPFERGFGTAFARQPEVVLQLAIDDEATESAPKVPDTLRTIVPLDTTGAMTQDVALTQQTVGDTTTFGINGAAMTTTLHAKVGETDVWDVHNETDANHPFHLHGFFFQVVGDDGTITGEWKDTLDIPRRERRKLVVKYDDRPGSWMFHCHILDHADLGMMAMLMLER